MSAVTSLTGNVRMPGHAIDCGRYGAGDVTSGGTNWRYATEIPRDLLFTGMGVWLAARLVTALGLERSSGEATLQGALADERATNPASVVPATNENQGVQHHG